MIWLLAAIFVLVVGATVTILLVASPTPDPVEERLRVLVQERTAQPLATAALPDNPADETLTLKDRLTQEADRVLAGVNFASKIQLRLRKADWRLHVSEFLALQGLLALAGAGIGLMLMGGPVWLGVAILGFYVPMFLVGRSERQRLKLFDQQLPDALTLIANSLRSGYAFQQAMELVSKEMPDPIAREFGQVIKETRVNIPIEDSLVALTRRVPSVDLDLVVTAVLIQRQIGGNLAEVLDRIVGTIRDRIKLQGQIRTLTAQGRMSGWIVSLLPVALAFALYVMNPEYISPMFTNPLGLAMLGLAAVMMGAGIFIIRRMVNLEV